MRMLSRIVSVVLLACCAKESLGFQTPFVPRSLAIAGRISRVDSSLHMGLRSFLKTKVLRRDEKGSKGNSNNKKDAPVEKPPTKKFKGTTVVATVASEKTAVAKTAAPTTTVDDIPDATAVARKPEVKRPIGETESRKVSKLPPIHTETVKERLNRVRSGMMTDDEKKAFLRTALSAKDTTISRTPLRQKLPDDRVEGDRSAGSNATPFPTLLKNVASGWGKNETRSSGEQPLRNWKDGVQLSDQKKKRAYFEMVTDPNRFHTYKSSVVTRPGNATEPTEFHDGVILPLLFDEDLEEEEGLTSVPEAEEDKAKVAEDLGSRLEKAAAAQEVAAKAKEKERLEKEKRREEQRLEQKRRIEELHKKQQLELEKKELELKARKREEELAMEREKEMKRREEEARRREMEAAQDAYWAKKLRAEREARIDNMSQQQKEDFVKQEALEAERAAEIARQESTEKPATPIVTYEAASISEKPDAGAQPPPPLGVLKKKANPFEEEQERKRQEMERAKDEQIARLRALNSPLPAPPRPSSPNLPPRTVDTAVRGHSVLSNLMNPPKPAPVPPIPTVEEPKAEQTVAEMMKQVDDNEEPEPEPAASKSGLLSSLLGGKKNNAAAAEKDPVPQAPPPAPTKRRVVRQPLPLGDDEEDDDFDAFARNGAKTHLSIADALKAAGESGPSGNQEQRSKMWGVDMSRIAKSLEDEKNN